MRLKWFLILAALIILIAGAPLFISMGAGVFASHHGCHLDEGGVYPCVVDGTDYGHRLNVLFMLGWFGMVTVPPGLIALAVLCGVFAISWIVRFARARKNVSPSSPE